MFYFSVLENGISKLPGGDPEVRSEIEQIVQEKGLLYLHQKLTEVDPISAKRIKTQDTQRLKRAYEIFTITGQPPSSVIAESCPQNLRIQYRKIALFRPREILHKRIEVRFMDMIERGLVSEVEGLAKSIRKPEILPSMRSVGYRQVIDYLYGKLTDTEMIEKGVASTRQLAKRQLTWLRNQSNVAWVNAENSNLEKMIVKYLESMNIHADRT